MSPNRTSLSITAPANLKPNSRHNFNPDPINNPDANRSSDEGDTKANVYPNGTIADGLLSFVVGSGRLSTSVIFNPPIRSSVRINRIIFDL